MPYIPDARGWLLAALRSVESYANDVDTLVKVNGLNADEPAVSPADGAETPSTSGAAAATPEKEEDATTTVDEDKEIAARKKELDALNAEYKDVPYGSKAELVHLEKRWDKNGDEYYIRQQKAAPRTLGKDWWEKHILAVIRHFDPDHPEKEKIEKATLEVYSEHLRKILAQVIGDYPGVSFRTKHVSLRLPAHCLYHYLSELHAEAETLQEGSIELEHLKILLNFIEKQFADTIEQVKNLRPQNLISYDTLWTLFRPGTIIHARIRGYDRAFKLQSYHVTRDDQDNAGFHQYGAYMDYDGENFGMRYQELKLLSFIGSKNIASLTFAPLDMRPNADELRKTLIERGKRFQSMRGQCYGEYVGAAIEQGAEVDKKFSIKSRVMIDGTSYNRVCPDFSWEAEDEDADRTAEDRLFVEEMASNSRMAAPKAIREFTDEEYLLATNVLRGFSFADKKWFELFIDNFSDIEWNQVSFDRLVLPEDSKKLLLALVTTHLSLDGSGFDDIIKGKGRGLVILLHGSRGMGKTLTAECIAEYTGRPLLVLSAVNLGTSRRTLPRMDDAPDLQESNELHRNQMDILPADLERELKRIFDLAHTWKAVLLIDEADVFLAERTLTDVHRNALVSVFLRLLEHYQGILFLTTNRVNTFDPAFKSRIHMALQYDNIDTQVLWKAQLKEIKSTV
ncbi:hypothetical protein B0H12DRAFT_33079 [Mycena haematopus]|nr:hypothetical protein B0H12DRAFT_33079 [Mycena haematopus]